MSGEASHFSEIESSFLDGSLFFKMVLLRTSFIPANIVPDSVNSLF
jgi:hypothetical protein